MLSTFANDTAAEPDIESSPSLSVADAASVTGNLHSTSYQFDDVTGQLKIALPEPDEPIWTLPPDPAVIAATSTKRVSSLIGVVVLTTAFAVAAVVADVADVAVAALP